MARFEAPVYLLCGDHDHEATFTRYIANSPVGTIDYGKYHGLLLLDHGNHPIARDDDQVRWVLQDLEANRGRTFNFIVTHSDELGLIRRLREMGIAEQAVHDFKLRMIICGGQSDWDYREFSSLLIGLPGLHYIRTGQSSTAVRDKAPGESRYRVIEVNNERISYVYPADYFDPRIQYSIPAGRIRQTFAGPNDGSQDVVSVSIANALNRSWNDCRMWLRVRKDPARPMPSVAGGTLLRCLDVGASWACEVGFDLPDKGAITVQAGVAEPDCPAAAGPAGVQLPGSAGIRPAQRRLRHDVVHLRHAGDPEGGQHIAGADHGLADRPAERREPVAERLRSAAAAPVAGTDVQPDAPHQPDTGLPGAGPAHAPSVPAGRSTAAADYATGRAAAGDRRDARPRAVEPADYNAAAGRTDRSTVAGRQHQDLIADDQRLRQTFCPAADTWQHITVCPTPSGRIPFIDLETCWAVPAALPHEAME